jgi:hypothetical protein
LKISIAENGSFSTLNYIVYEKDYSSNYKRGNFHDDDTEHLQQFLRDLIYQQVRYKVEIMLHR